MTRKALGRGLEALIPVRPAPAEDTSKPAAAAAVAEPPATQEVAIDRVQPNPYQPRHSFDAARMDELADSLRKNGVLQPLVVRKTRDGYELVAGERRLRAAKIAGLATVPVHVREVDDHELLQLALLENLQREDLNPIEEARAYRRLMDEFGMTQLAVGERVSKSRAAVANTLRLLQLPADLQARIESGQLSAGHARALLQADTLEEQTQIANLVQDQHLSVRDVERIAQGKRRSQRKEPGRAPELEELQKRLETRFGTRVRIRARKADGSAGRVEIDYYGAGDLEKIFEIAGVQYLL